METETDVKDYDAALLQSIPSATQSQPVLPDKSQLTTSSSGRPAPTLCPRCGKNFKHARNIKRYLEQSCPNREKDVSKIKPKNYKSNNPEKVETPSDGCTCLHCKKIIKQARNLKRHLTTCTIAKANSSDINVGPSTRHRYRTQHQSETNTEGYSMTPLDNLVIKTDLSAQCPGQGQATQGCLQE